MLLDYVVHLNPTSHKDVLSKIRTFALGKGWTSVEYQTAKAWTNLGAGVYGWTAGNNDFLQLNSIGYGSQDMTYRFYAEGTALDPLQEWLDCVLTNPNNKVYGTSSTNPWLQNIINASTFRSISLSPGTMTALWIFGNQQFIIAVIQVSTTVFQMLYFGTIELFNTAETEFNIIAINQFNASYKWHQAETHPNYWYLLLGGIQIIYDNFWMDAALRSMATYYSQNVMLDKLVIMSGGSYNKLTPVINRNAYSDKRILIKPTVFYLRPSNSIRYPVGNYPFYFINFQGLTAGQVLIYGSEEYIAFPAAFPTSDKFGIAFRIA